MAEAEEIQPLVVDNGTGMVKVSSFSLRPSFVSEIDHSSLMTC